MVTSFNSLLRYQRADPNPFKRFGDHTHSLLSQANKHGPLSNTRGWFGEPISEYKGRYPE